MYQSVTWWMTSCKRRAAGEAKPMLIYERITLAFMQPLGLVSLPHLHCSAALLIDDRVT